MIRLPCQKKGHEIINGFMLCCGFKMSVCYSPTDIHTLTIHAVLILIPYDYEDILLNKEDKMTFSEVCRLSGTIWKVGSIFNRK